MRLCGSLQHLAAPVGGEQLVLVKNRTAFFPIGLHWPDAGCVCEIFSPRRDSGGETLPKRGRGADTEGPTPTVWYTLDQGWASLVPVAVEFFRLENSLTHTSHLFSPLANVGQNLFVNFLNSAAASKIVKRATDRK
jgi:hypothetical protein